MHSGSFRWVIKIIINTDCQVSGLWCRDLSPVPKFSAERIYVTAIGLEAKRKKRYFGSETETLDKMEKLAGKKVGRVGLTDDSRNKKRKY